MLIIKKKTKEDEFHLYILIGVIIVILIVGIFGSSIVDVIAKASDKAQGKGLIKPECNDKIDNDKDGLIDYKINKRTGVVLGDPDCTDSGDDSESPTFFCGDNICTLNEDCSSCPTDCGSCTPANETPTNYCGDGSCNGGETCNTCLADCGECTISTCSSISDEICPDNCAAGSDIDCCINKGYCWEDGFCNTCPPETPPSNETI